MDVRFQAWAGYQLAPSILTVISGTEGDCVGNGTIEIEPGWQLIATPIKYGYWDDTLHVHIHDGTTQAKFKNYILDQINDLYGPDNIEVANTYTGDQQAFYSYVVGSTPEGSPHNFNMIYADGTSQEVSGFWVKSLSASAFTISWGE